MYYCFETDIGRLAVLIEDDRIRQLWLPNELPDVPFEPLSGLSAELAAQVRAYLAGERRTFDLPLADVGGSDCRRRIMQAIAAIPYGGTATYASLGPARVVGNVCAGNPLPLLIPCHRIVPAHGAPGNYRGGQELKRHLLALEAYIAAS